MTTKTRPTSEQRSRLAEITERLESEDGAHEITIAASNVARDNYDLDISSLRLDNYRLNPVVMWAHGRSNVPIGRSQDVWKDDQNRLHARFEFLEGDEMADRVRNAWDKGFIRAASISWGGGDIQFLDNGRIRETNAELYEWSLVPVPADPAALRQAERSLDLPEGTLGEQEAQPATVGLTEQQVRAIIAEVLAERQAQEPPLEDDESDWDEISRDLGSLLASMKENVNA